MHARVSCGLGEILYAPTDLIDKVCSSILKRCSMDMVSDGDIVTMSDIKQTACGRHIICTTLCGEESRYNSLVLLFCI